MIAHRGHINAVLPVVPRFNYRLSVPSLLWNSYLPGNQNGVYKRLHNSALPGFLHGLECEMA